MESDNTEGEDVTQQQVEAATKTLTGAAIPPAGLREDHILNAVSFLSHPKVQGSSEQAKTSFLEKKGLTPAEIREAFSRVGNTSSGAASVTSTATPALPAASSVTPYHGTQATISALQPRQALQQISDTTRSLRWTQVLLGASALFAGAYALQQVVTPLAMSLYRRFYGVRENSATEKDKLLEEKRTAEIVAAAIESQTNELKSTVDSLKDMVAKLENDKKAASIPASLSVDDLRSELQAFANTLTAMTTPTSNGDAEVRGELAQIKQMLSSKSGFENGGPKMKNSAVAYPPYSGANGTTRAGPPATRALQKEDNDHQASDPPESVQPSYMEVLEMLERGETPPNVRTDINDKPPFPNQTLPHTSKAPRAKPWERSGSTASSLSNGELRPGSDVPALATRKPDRKHTGAWRPPPLPQRSVDTSAFANKTESESASIDAASVHSADQASEIED